MPYKDKAARDAYQKEYQKTYTPPPKSDAAKAATAAYQKEYHQKHKEANKARVAATGKKWREDNPERAAELAKNYREANRDKLAARQRQRLLDNPDEILATRKRYNANNPDYQFNYRQKNPDKVSDQVHRRRAKKEGNGVFVITRKFMRNLYNSPCFACGASESITADHIIPIAKGGRHSEGNLQPLCGSCNSSKHSKLWIEFIAKKTA